MLAVISPAKTLDFDTPMATDTFTQPSHLTQSRKLVKRLRQLSAPDLVDLMGVSGNIAELNQQRFKQWKTPFKPENARQAMFAFKGDVYIGLDAYSMNSDNVDFAQNHLRILSGLYGLLRPLELNQQRFKQWKTPFKPENARQAMFAFKGDVYIGLDAYSMTPGNVDFAQNHLRILSGLYGLLRPLDLMQAYRLEMGTRIDTESGSNLYQFWDGRITKNLNQELKQTSSDTLINLASNEYFKSVKPKQLKAEVITPVFKDYNKGNYQLISFFAKKARGMMARYMIDNEINDAESLKAFDRDGYAYNASLSNPREWVFTRRQ